jgi:hypothetical protein
VLLFGGLVVLPWIGQCIWIAIIMAIYIRLMLVISRREELLERIDLPSEDTERSVWCDVHERRAVISKSEGALILDAGPKSVQERTPRRIPFREPKREMTRPVQQGGMFARKGTINTPLVCIGHDSLARSDRLVGCFFRPARRAALISSQHQPGEIGDFNSRWVGREQYAKLKQARSEGRTAFMAMKFGDSEPNEVVDRCFRSWQA